jgi:hypothetical protein
VPESPTYVQTEKTAEEPSFDKRSKTHEQWLLVKQNLQIARSAKPYQEKEELFSLPLGAWSSVDISSEGGLSFFHLHNRFQEKSTSSKEQTSAQQVLSLDAKRVFMDQLLNLMESKKAIVFVDNLTGAPL